MGPIFVFGLIIGSFLNVLIERLPKNQSILGRSRCQNCKTRIKWHDNIPFLSFIFLKGRCRNCKSKISRQYPIVELLTGLLFLSSFVVYGEEMVSLIYILFLISLFLVIAFIDFKHFIIPDKLLIFGFLVSFIFFLLPIRPISPIGPISPISSLFGTLFFAGIFLVIFLVSRGKWLGFGDVKLAALAGFIFGFRNSVNIFYLTFFFGFILAIILLGFTKAGLKTRVPLGSLISASTILFLLTGFDIYSKIYG